MCIILDTFCFFQTLIGNSSETHDGQEVCGGEDSRDVAESVLKEIVVGYSLVCIILDIFCFFQTSIGNSWSSVFSMVSGHYDVLF